MKYTFDENGAFMAGQKRRIYNFKMQEKSFQSFKYINFLARGAPISMQTVDSKVIVKLRPFPKSKFCTPLIAN